jgi:hypothetical protein
LLQVFREPGSWNVSGTLWSLAGGAAGAMGALGIIMAFNFGGKPIFVMPLVFGGAPVVNTFITIVHEGTIGQVSLLFYISLVMVIAGAVSVLVFAPRPPRSRPARDAVPGGEPAAGFPRQPEPSPPETSRRHEPSNPVSHTVDRSAADREPAGREAEEETIYEEETIDPDDQLR